MPQCFEIGVVIPVYNGEPFVGAAIESVLAQAGPSFHIAQVIVVDNNSTDGTWETMRKLVDSQNWNRVTLIRELRPNAAHARNAGAKLATAEWLAFLDADDLWLPGKLERQIAAKAEHPEVEMFFTLGQEFHSPELDREQRASLKLRPLPYPLLTPSSLLLRREAFARVGDLPDVPGGEFIAWYGWARDLGLTAFVVPEVLVQRRIHAANTTRTSGSTAGYPLAAKWLLDRRREARPVPSAAALPGLETEVAS